MTWTSQRATSSTAGKERILFSLPTGWNVIASHDISTVPEPLILWRRSAGLDHPSAPPGSKNWPSGMDVVLLFDDLQRPTPVHLALPEIMDRLNRAGIPDERLTGSVQEAPILFHP